MIPRRLNPTLEYSYLSPGLKRSVELRASLLKSSRPAGHHGFGVLFVLVFSVGQAVAVGQDNLFSASDEYGPGVTVGLGLLQVMVNLLSQISVYDFGTAEGLREVD